MRASFAIAEGESRRGYVIVESLVTGRDYRCLIVGGKMQAIAERVPAHVVGDGTHTVAELVEITNADPRRGVGHEKVLTRIKVDDAAVELVRDQGFELDDVPPKDQMVKLALTGNMSTGGISVDRTFDAHPDNVEIAEEAARMIGLDVAGIDFICPDIASPVRETGGAICEVNAAPGFRMHTHPTVGEPQFIAKPVVDLLFPPGSPSRVPIVAVTGTNGKTTTSRMIAHIFKGIGHKVGMTSTDGIVIDERLVYKADASGPRSARMVLQNPRVDFAVMEVARGGILREGLGYDRNDVAVVTNVAPDHLGMQRHRHPRAARRRQGRHRGSGAPQRVRRAQRRRRPRPQDASALLRRDRLVLAAAPRQQGPRVHRGPLPPRWPRRRARPHRARRHDRHQARPSLDAARLDPPAARRPSAAPRSSTSPTPWLRPVRPSPPAPGCTRSGRACAPSPPATTSPPAG